MFLFVGPSVFAFYLEVTSFVMFHSTFEVIFSELFLSFSVVFFSLPVFGFFTGAALDSELEDYLQPSPSL